VRVWRAVGLAAILVALLASPGVAQGASCPTAEQQAASAEAQTPATKSAAQQPRSGSGKKQAAAKRKAARRKAAKKKVTRSTLTPTESSTILNFGRQRGTKEIDIVLTADPALKRFAPKKLELYVPRRFPREGAGMETLAFKEPTFSTPEVHESGTRITFTACLDAKEEAPGSYKGEIVVSGPQVEGSTRVAVIANVKEWRWFLVGLVLALIAAFALLLYRPMQNNPTGDAWRDATLRSPAWWVETIVSLVAGAIAAWAIYSQDPAWGSDVPTALVSLIGAAFAAAGVQTLISTARKGGGGGGGAALGETVEEPPPPSDPPLGGQPAPRHATR
jgi:hypothetical protein